MLGLALAVAAACLFTTGVALQALEARRAPSSARLRLSLLRRLIGRPLWLGGAVLAGAGVPLQILAFERAPLVVVQTAGAASLLLLLGLAARMLGERVRPRDLIAVTAIVGGIALVTVAAPPQAPGHGSDLAAAAVVGALGLAALAPFVLRGGSADRPLIVVAASGVGFAATNVAAKLIGDELSAGALAAAGAWAAAAALLGIAATLAEMSALQRSPATMVVPVGFAVQTVAPIVLSPIFLRIRWDGPLDAAGSALAVALTLAGAGALTRNAGVAHLMSGHAPRRA